MTFRTPDNFQFADRPPADSCLFLCSPSEATDHQLAGQRSEGIVIVVFRSGIKRPPSIRDTTDFKPDCVIVFCVRLDGPSKHQLAGRQSDGVVNVVRCSGIERRTAINCATDFMPDCVIVFCVRDHGPSDINSPDDDQSELCFAPSASPTVIRRRARDTASNGDNASRARLTCG